MKCLIKFLIIPIILSLTGSGFCLAEEITPAKLLISEVQISGENGEPYKDYVKIYNPNNTPVDLGDYSLVKRTGPNDSEYYLIGSWPAKTIIAGNDYHIWASSKTNFITSPPANSFTTQTLADDNGIAIRFGKKDEGAIIDSVGWGDYQGIFLEILPSNLEKIGPRNPTAGEKLIRLNNLDTDDNKTDFPLPDTDNNADTETENETSDETEDNNQAIANVGSGGSIASTTTNTVVADNEVNVVIVPPLPETKIYISEILPDPLGIDIDYSCDNCGEFIEVYNAGKDPVDLSGWRLQVDQQKPFIINHFLPLAPNAYFAFYRPKTGLILNNYQGEVKLYKPDSSTAWQTIKYKNAIAGSSYSLEQPPANNWQWNKLITPGQVNTINYAPMAEFYFVDNLSYNEDITFDASDSYDLDNEIMTFNWDFGDGQTSDKTNPLHHYQYPGNYNVILKVSDGLNETIKQSTVKIVGQVTLLPEALKIYNEPKVDNANDKQSSATASSAVNNNLITARGVVVVLPNTYGSQYFYILPMRTDETVEGQALQIYSYYKTFPALALGDYIEAQGEISETSDDSRLKIKDISDIQILDHDYIVVEREIKTDQINSQLRGQLIAVSGQIVDKQGQNIFLNDESGQAIIYLSTGSNISTSDLTIGQTYRIIGLVRQVSGQLKIMPRSNQDIAINETAVIIETIVPEILGEKIEAQSINTDMVLPANNKQQKILEYLLIVAAVIIIALVIYIFQTNKKTS